MTERTAPTPRMRAILDAAVQVVARGGMRGLTHRAVDAQAGLSQGSTSGYLRTRTALVGALAEDVSSRLLGEIDVLAEEQRGGRPVEDVAAAAVDLFARWLREPALVMTKAELTQEAIRTPDVQEILAPYRGRLHEIVTAMLTESGGEAPQERARALIAAIEGVLSGALFEPEAQRERYLRATTETIIAAFVARPALADPGD